MIVVAGEALIDLILGPDDRLTAVPGGGPLNAARTIARLGVPVAFLGRLSDDRFGQILRQALEGDGVDLSLVEDASQPTTLAIAELDDRGAATYRFHTANTSAPGLSDTAVRVALATDPSAIYVASLGLVLLPMARSLVDGIGHASPATLVMVDPNCRPPVIPNRSAYRTRLAAVFARADVVKVSADDLGYLTPNLQAVDAARDLLDRGPAAVLLTDGPRPVVCLTPSATFSVAVPEVPVVDTIGAGDAFGGAFLASWTERGLGRDALRDEVLLRAAVERSVEVASLTCQRAGADPPRRDELAW